MLGNTPLPWLEVNEGRERENLDKKQKFFQQVLATLSSFFFSPKKLNKSVMSHRSY